MRNLELFREMIVEQTTAEAVETLEHFRLVVADFGEVEVFENDVVSVFDGASFSSALADLTTWVFVLSE